jgi:hypothetical protein
MQLAVRFLMGGGPDGTVEPSAMPSAMSRRQHRPSTMRMRRSSWIFTEAGTRSEGMLAFTDGKPQRKKNAHVSDW